MEREAKAALAFVLLASRVCGVAPLRLEARKAATRSYASCAHALYAIVLLAILNIMVITKIVIDYKQNKGLNDDNIVEFLGRCIDLIFLMLIVDFGAYSGRGRILRIFQLIEHNIRKSKPVANSEERWWIKKRLLINVIVWMVPIGFQVWDIIFNVDLSIISNKQLYYMLFGAQTTVSIIATFVQLQVILLLNWVQVAFNSLTKELLYVLDNIHQIRPLNNDEEERLRRVGRTYKSMSDTISAINKNDGWLMLIMFLYYFMSMMLGVYWIIDWILIDGIGTADVSTHEVFGLAWALVNMVLMILYLEPCHQVYTKVEQIRVIASRLMYRTQAPGEPIALQVEALCKLLLLDNPTFSPLDVCTISRSLCTTAVSAATTWMVFMVQWRMGNASKTKKE